MTSKEKLIEVIKYRGRCSESTELTCGDIDEPDLEKCPLIGSNRCEGTWNKEGYLTPASPERYDVRYHNALNKFVELYGEDDLLEVLM